MRRLIAMCALAVIVAGCGSSRSSTTTVTATLPTTVAATVTSLRTAPETVTPTGIPAATVAGCKQFEAAATASGLRKLAASAALGQTINTRVFKSAVDSYVPPKYVHANAAIVAMENFSHLIEATKSKGLATINA